MKTFLISSLVSALSLAALADPKSDAKAAAEKLAAAPCYSWTAKTEMANSQFPASTIMGKADKGGFAVVTQERDGNKTVAVIKGEKGAVKTDEGWKTAEELRAAAQGGGGGGGRGGMRAGMLLRTRLPADDAVKMLDHVKEVKAMDGCLCGELTEAGAKELMSLGRGRGGQGGQAPEAKNAKGMIKYWLKDGVVSKMEVKVSGTMNWGGEDRDIERTTTYEIKDVGTTTVEVPAEAKAKIGA